jgi:butyrate kinase
MLPVLHGKVDSIVLSGEIFHWKFFTDQIVSRIASIAPIGIYPNEEEVEALARNGQLILLGQAQILEYE